MSSKLEYICGSAPLTLLSMFPYYSWICLDENQGYVFLKTFCKPFSHWFSLTFQLVPYKFQPSVFPSSLWPLQKNFLKLIFPSLQTSWRILSTMIFQICGSTITTDFTFSSDILRKKSWRYLKAVDSFLGV